MERPFSDGNEASVHPETRINVGGFHLINVGESHLIRHLQFPIRKGGIFRLGKEIEGLRGGVPMYAAQETSKIDAAKAEKDPFRTETRLFSFRPQERVSRYRPSSAPEIRCSNRRYAPQAFGHLSTPPGYGQLDL